MVCIGDRRLGFVRSTKWECKIRANTNIERANTRFAPTIRKLNVCIGCRRSVCAEHEKCGGDPCDCPDVDEAICSALLVVNCLYGWRLGRWDAWGIGADTRRWINYELRITNYGKGGTERQNQPFVCGEYERIARPEAACGKGHAPKIKNEKLKMKIRGKLKMKK